MFAIGGSCYSFNNQFLTEVSGIPGVFAHNVIDSQAEPTIDFMAVLRCAGAKRVDIWQIETTLKERRSFRLTSGVRFGPGLNI